MSHDANAPLPAADRAAPVPSMAPGREVPGTPTPAARKHAPAIPPPPAPAPFPPESIRAQCEALIARYPERVAALIPILHLAQKHCGGWISPELEGGIAKYLGVSDQHVRGVVTFYTMFNQRPVGRHHLQLCRTLSCKLRGAEALREKIREKTGLSPGQSDAQGRFSVTEVECLGLCEVAPALFVNEQEHVNVTPEALEKLLDGLK